MNTALPINVSSQPRRTCGALTILEMLVSTAMLAFIVLGLTAMFIQTQKAFKTGIKQSNITDAGRTIIDMIAADLSQMSDPHFTNVTYPTYPSTAFPNPPTFFWQYAYSNDMYQFFSNNGVEVVRSNQCEDIFVTIQTNANWLGVGYIVSNWFTNGAGGPIPGVGTLYRYVSQTNAPLNISNLLFANFNSGPTSNFHRIADGVVHLKIYAFNADGNETYYERSNYDSTGNVLGMNYLQYPVIETNLNTNLPPWYNTNLLVTNYLPHSIDIELGILEPEAFEHARALYTAGAFTAASNYLANAAGQVQVFREHIVIPGAP